jgi:hypothetical protein
MRAVETGVKPATEEEQTEDQWTAEIRNSLTSLNTVAVADGWVSSLSGYPNFL